MGYPPKLSFELARITTIVTPQSIQYGQKRWKNEDVFIGYLPQGFPTSPLLANKVCYHLDELLSQIAKDHRCSYTRYSDDIVFSTNFCNRNVAKIIIKRTNNVLASFGFRPNHRKTSIVPPGARKIVTGLVVNTDEPKLKRELKDQIRSHLYYAKKYGITNHCKKVGFNSLVGFKNHLEGLINYAKSIDKNLGNKYLNEFNKINWF